MFAANRLTSASCKRDERSAARSVAEREPRAECDEHQVRRWKAQRQQSTGRVERRPRQGRLDDCDPHHQRCGERDDAGFDGEIAIADRRTVGDHRHQRQRDERSIRGSHHAGELRQIAHAEGRVPHQQRVGSCRHDARAGDRNPRDPIAVADASARRTWLRPRRSMGGTIIHRYRRNPDDAELPAAQCHGNAEA